MSTEVAVKDQQQVAIPDYLRDLINPQSVSGLASIISNTESFPRITLKGRTFHFKEGSEEVRASREAIHMVIVGATPDGMLRRKTLYVKKYDPNSADPPDCRSADGVVPDSSVSTPMCANCASCQYNKWGSDISLTGKKSKKCRDSKIIFVVDPREIEAGTLYAVNVTVASLKALSDYGKFLAENRIPLSACITTMDFADSDFPQLTFKFAGILKEDACKAAISRASKAEWKDRVIQIVDSEGPVSEAPIARSTVDVQTSTGNTSGAVTKVATPESVDEILNKWGGAAQ